MREITNYTHLNALTETIAKKKSVTGIILSYLVPLIVSVGLCWLLFRDFNFGRMWQVIVTQCRFEWIALMLCISVLSHIFRAFRWRIQLRALGIQVGIFPLILSIFGTYAVNLVFPRLGEVWRTGYIARRSHSQFTVVFGSMIADRLADTATVLLLTILAFIVAAPTILSYLAQNQATYQSLLALITSPWLWLSIIIVLAAAWLVFTRMASNRIIVAVKKALAELWHGFAVIATMPGKGRWLVFTVALWGCYFTQMFVSFFAFDFTAQVFANHGLAAVLVTFVLSSISMGVPSNGGIGPWQWAVIFALGIYGLDAENAATFANLELGCNTLLLIALGLFTFAAVALQRHTTPSTETQQLNNHING